MPRIPILITVLYATDAILAFAYLAMMRLHITHEKLVHLLHLEQESNLPTWYSSMQLLLLAFLLGIFAWKNFDRSQWRSWLLAALPGIFLLMSLDEIAEIHEYLGYQLDVLLPGGTRENTPFSYTGLWGLVIAGPVLLLLWGFVLSLRSYFAATPGVLLKLLIGIFLLIGGAGGMDMLANFIESRFSTAHILEVFVEESMEMAGVTTMIWAAHSLLAARNFRLLLDRNTPR